MRNWPKAGFVAVLVGLGLWAFERSLTPAVEPTQGSAPPAPPLSVEVYPWVHHQPPQPAPEPIAAPPENAAPPAPETESIPEPVSAAIPEPERNPAPENIEEFEPPRDLDWEYYQEAAMEAEMAWEAEGESIPYEEEVMAPPFQPQPEPDLFEPGF